MISSHDLASRVERRLRGLYDRTRYRLRIPEPGPGDAQLSPSFRHFVDASNPGRTAARYRELFPAEVDLELAEARRLTAHRFDFLGHAVTHGDRIDWSLDPVSGRDWSRGFSPDIVYRGPSRLGDIKLPWELNKHQYFFTLGKAAWLTGDSAFAREIVQQLDHWIEDNPYRRGINWISALEAGTRAVSWILAYPFFAGYGDAAFRDRLARSLAHHMVFVEKHLSTGRFANNHLVGDAAALVAGGLFLEHADSARWIEKGLMHLEAEISRQVAPDGVHAERAVSYHRFVLDQYLLIQALLTPNGRSLSATALAGMERMTTFLMDVATPDGRAPSFGDGDDARGLWFRADCPSDFRSPLAVGAVLFDRGDFKAVAGALPEEVFWLFGEPGVSAYQTLPARLPGHTSIAYPEGGYYVMRDGWSSSDALLVFDCGPVGYGPSGHGHADALSFQLYAAGYPFLTDPGAFSYNLDYDWRQAFRSTRAHNTVTVDEADQSVPADRMSWSLMAQARTRRWIATTMFDLVDGEHDGYRRLADPVTHRRVAVHLKPDVWVVWDHLAGTATHALELLLHLRPDCGVDLEDGGARTVLTSPAGGTLRVSIVDGGGSAVVPTVLEGTETERAAWFSPGYGTRVPSRALSVRRTFSPECTLTTSLSASARLQPQIAYADGILSVGLRRPENGEETLWYRAIGGAVVAARGVRCDGALLYTRSEDEAYRLIIATDVRELVIEGVVNVRAPMAIERVQLEGSRCEIVVDPASADDLSIEAPGNVTLVVNGRPRALPR